MPAKKDASKSAKSKSYMDKESKAEIDDIINKFDIEEKDGVSKNPVEEQPKDLNNVLNNDDEYDIESFAIDKEAKSDVDFNSDEYDIGLDNNEDANMQETTENNLDVLESDKSNIEVDDILVSSKAEEGLASSKTEDDLVSSHEEPVIKGLSEDNPNEELIIADMDIDNSESINEDIIKTKPSLLEVEEEVNEVVEEELILNIELEDIKTSEVSMDNKEYNEVADFDNDYLRPMKEAKTKMPDAVSKKNKKTVRKNDSVDLTPEPEATCPDDKKLPIAKPTLKFTPKAAKEYAKIRRKYKINKDRIFSENDYVDGFILARGEMLLRRYDALKVNGGNVGRILITNKRMLFNTSEKAEIPLSSVCGIRSAKYWMISWAKFVFSLMFLGIAAFTFVFDFTRISFLADRSWLIYIIIAVGAIFALIGIIFLFTFARRRFALKIFVNAALEFITYNSKRKKKESAIMEAVIVAMPGRQIDRFVREVGALIIQSREGYFDM